MTITAANLDFKQLNEMVKSSAESVCINECYGQRFIASGAKEKTITINGTPGNALGAYLDGAKVEVNGNAQDAVGDTMNDGKIIIHGNAGDALGYAMRGGSIYVKGDAGYRAGILMKEYENKKPVIVIGGSAGSFLGEYLAGGLIIVLGLDTQDVPLGYFTGSGMHGGKIFIRTNAEIENLPAQVEATLATKDDIKEIEQYITEFSQHFNTRDTLTNDTFYVLKPSTKNQYTQLYTKH